MTEASTLVKALDDAGYRLTEPRRLVAELIADQDGHFSAAELVATARARQAGIGRATVFRALDLFATLKLVERVDLPDGDHAYVGCEPAHHHHVICTTCGRKTDIEDCGMREVVREVSRRSGYRVGTHRIELFGTCPACLKASRD